MGVINNSPDIGNLEVKVVFDLTGTNPVINLTNQTTANTNVSPVPDLSALIWVLNIYSPTGTPIFQSDFTTPWKDAGDGNWTTAAITSAWPRPFGQIEWSDYRVEFQVKDTVGNIYDLNKSTNICRPAGNNKSTPDTFGHVKLGVETLCERSSLYIQDSDSKLYQGIEGANQSSYLAVDYPRDATGTLPAPYILTTFITDALVPFYQNGEHEATYYSIWRYDLGDNVFIDIRYTAQVAFPTQCNIDLCPIACEVAALEASITSGSCANVAEAQRKLNLITPKLLRAFIAKANPTCGIDLPALIDEIKAIGGFSCDCNTGSSGIGTAGVSIPPFIFSVNNEGGDVVASFSVTDGNVVLNIKDKHYTFTPGTGSIQLATSVGATTNTVSLNIDLDGLAEDIYQTTAASAYLLQLFNDLVINSGFNLTVDGKCVISNNACDITWVMEGITGSNAVLRWIVVGGVAQNLNYIFNTGTLAALQTYLNTLGLETFAVTNLGGGEIEISTSANTFNLGDIVYIDSSGGSIRKTAIITKNCNAFAPLTPTQIVQGILDWLCPLGAEKVYTSEEYQICYIDPTTKVKTIETIGSGSLLPTFFAALIARGCNTVDFIMSLKSVNCASIQELFADNVNQMGANDIILGTKQGQCARLYPVELGTRQLQLGAYDQDFINAFCTIVQICNGGKFCQPFNVFTLTPNFSDPTMDLEVAFEHDEAISVNIRYARIDLGGPLEWSEPVNELIGNSPYTFTGLDMGQYRVGITPVYADGRKCGETTKDTDSCTLANLVDFSASFDGTDINVNFDAGIYPVKITVQYPNGGKAIVDAGAGSGPIAITPPADVFGTYSVTIQVTCSSATGWYSPPSAPAVFDVTPPNNSSVTNNASFTLAGIVVSVTNETGTNSVLNATSLDPTGVADFYVADGFYSEIAIFSVALSTGWTAYLVTEAGVYILADGKFQNVTVNGGTGGQIVIIDTSPLP